MKNPNSILGNPLCYSGIRAQGRRMNGYISISIFNDDMAVISNSVENFDEKFDNHSCDKNEKGNIEAYVEGCFDQSSKEIEEGEIEVESDPKDHLTEHSDAWVTFLDTLHIPNYVEGSKEYLRGGYTEDNKWPKIAIKLGLDKKYAVNLMVIYQGYLDLMSWKYLITKHGENNIGKPSGLVTADEKVAGNNINTAEDGKEKMEDIKKEDKEPVEIGSIKNELDFQIEDLDVELSQDDYDLLEDFLLMDEDSIAPVE
ncbi:hypothetical protein E3N88_15431 [Mikania micrantha]|uniref:ARID domain-containing protein n=1 Tax=Mikania micrantha TaxID=192012 RepID=A0A5N6NX80_9ASTR|nr:hypothetical protein E3N88_15431 [Mikania micrantha]